jgi:hypothetical protein
MASARAFRLCLTVVHSTSVPAFDECVAGRSVLLWAVTMTSVPEQVPSVGPKGMAAAVESLVVGGPRGRLEVGASVLPSAVSEYPIPFPRPVTDLAVLEILGRSLESVGVRGSEGSVGVRGSEGSVGAVVSIVRWAVTLVPTGVTLVWLACVGVRGRVESDATVVAAVGVVAGAAAGAAPRATVTSAIP